VGDDSTLRRLDRRQFLRASGTVGAVAAFPGLLSACGGSDEGGGGSGDAIKIGYVTPSTGALAGFGEADDFILKGVRDRFKDGIETKDGTRDVEIIVKDSQSSPDRAGAVASDLILQDGVDMIVVAGTPENVNPVADQCELNGVPCVSDNAPWQPYFFGRKGDPNKPFKWTFHFFWGIEDLTAVYVDLWKQIDTNNTVGGLWPNDSDGNAFSNKETGFPPVLEKNGFTLVDPGRYENATNDFSAQINRFKRGNAELLTGVPIPPDFTNFYKQAAQQGYRPKAATIAKAVLFPSAVDALGDLGEGVSTEVWWSPEHPFSSSLTEQSAKELADAYTEDTNKPWTQPIGFVHALFEVAADVFGRAADPKDKQAIVDAVKATDMETIVGPVSWKNGPVPNVAKVPLVGGQWRRSGGSYELVIVSNSIAKQIPVADRLRPIET
jgi:branched-chain amino acid transport system substrate-binding protein